MTTTIDLRLGRLKLFLWAGSWTWPPERLICDYCWNVYLGPFGIEWLTPDRNEG